MIKADPAPDRSHRNHLLAVALVAATLAACSDGSASGNAACKQLSHPVVLPAGIAPVLERVVGKNPNLLAVLVRPWTPNDRVQVRVFLLREHSAEVAELARQLREAGYTVLATLDQADAYQEFSLMFQAHPDLVHGVTAQDLPASVILNVPTREARSRLQADIETDPRVNNVVLGQDVPSVGRFAAAVYDVAHGELDRLETVLPATSAGELRNLRALAVLVDAPAPAAPFDVEETAALVSRLVDFAASECGMHPTAG